MLIAQQKCQDFGKYDTFESNLRPTHYVVHTTMQYNLAIALYVSPHLYNIRTWQLTDQQPTS